MIDYVHVNTAARGIMRTGQRRSVYLFSALLVIILLIILSAKKIKI